jgi:recombination protein RecA
MVRVKVEKPEKKPIEVKPKKSGGLYFGSPRTDTLFIPSGCKVLDLALGGGWARRRIANIVGNSSTGKSLLAIEASANFIITEPKGIVRYREAESAFDPDYAEALGFPIDKVDFGDPIDTIEDLFEDLEKVIEGAKGPEIYIIDSLDALSDRGEMGRPMDEGSYGTAKAKMMSQLFRRTCSQLAEKDITVFVVSQIRDKIGVMFGKKTTRSGGRALDFYASQALWLTRTDKIKRKKGKVERVVGIEVQGVVEKNKIGLPYREATFPIIFGHGIGDWEACAEYLKSVNGEIVDKTTPLANLHRMVEESWWELENHFLEGIEPKYKKIEG